jgi:hypothetical protein
MSDANAQVITFTPGMRTLVCDAIEAMVLLLDEIDGDAELEDDGTAEECGDAEPSFGARHGLDQTKTWNSTGAEIEDGEHEHDGREPDADFEPSDLYARSQRSDNAALTR